MAVLYQTLPLEIISFIPELFFISCVLILLLWCLILSTDKKTNVADNINSTLLMLLNGVNIITIALLCNNLNKTKILFYSSIIIDNYSTVLKIAILSLTIIFLKLSTSYIQQHFQEDFEYPILIALSIFAILIMLSAYDLITLYLSIEMQSLCLYILATFKRKSQFSSEAGLKYFILGAFSSSLLLFGMSLLYGFTGSTNFSEISKIITCLINSTDNVPYNLKLGLILFICGFLFKLTAVPFHIWSPDVYEGSPLITTVFFSTIPKAAVFCVFTKVLLIVFFELHCIWEPILKTAALITITFASLAALYQKKLKRFLAYSSISHAGYMLIGIAAGTITGIHAFFLYLTIYLITALTFFGLILSLKQTNNRNLTYITDLLFLENVHPLNKIVFIITLFSMASVPPLIGFFAKFYILFTAIENFYYLLVFFSIICSTLSAFYYIRIIKVIYFENSANLNYPRIQFNTSNLTWSLIGLLSISYFIIAPNPLISKTYQLILSL